MLRLVWVTAGSLISFVNKKTVEANGFDLCQAGENHLVSGFMSQPNTSVHSTEDKRSERQTNLSRFWIGDCQKRNSGKRSSTIQEEKMTKKDADIGRHFTT